ncbi:MAG: hypothetical protein AB7O50_03265 [Pseudolabrys sp.]
MQKSDTHDYAYSLYAAHGDKSLAEAAQRARQFEENGKHDDAHTWRSIAATIRELRGPKAS